MPSKVSSVFSGQKLAVLPNGNFVFYYGTNKNYYAQVVSSNGTLISTPFLSSVAPTVTLLPNGSFLLFYSTVASAYVQVISADGSLLGMPIPMGVATTVLQNNSFVVIAQNGALGYSIQIVDANGALISAPILFPSIPTITPLQNGDFVVMYQNVNNYNLQVVSSSGGLLGIVHAFGVAQPNITTLPSGNFLVVYGSSGSYSVQFVSGQGVLVGSITPSSVSPNIIVSSSGNFAVVRSTSGVGAPTYFLDIRNGNDNTLLGTPITMNSNPLSVVILSNGNFMVASSAFPYYSIQTFSSTGAVVGSRVQIQTSVLSSITVLSNSYAVVTYLSLSNYYVLLMGPSGTAVGSAIQLTASVPSLTPLSGGNSLVTYQNGTSYYTQFFTTNGKLVGGTLLSTVSSVGLTTLSNGNFVAAYSDGTNYYAQVMTQMGVLIGNAIQLNAYPPNVTPLPNGNFLLNYQTATGYYGQLFNANVTGISDVFQLTDRATSGFANLLVNDNVLIGWSVNAGMQLQIFYVGPNLILETARQSLSYFQDKRNDLTKMTILTEYNTVTATLTLSDPQAGTLDTTGNSTATFSPKDGIWQASGDVNEVNTLLNTTQFVPAANYKTNFTLSLDVVDEGGRNATETLTMIGVPTAPVLKNNDLNITEGQTVILTNANLQVSPTTRPVTYTISRLDGASFESVSNPGKAITQFTQQQINNQEIAIISNRTAPVSYEVILSDGTFTLSPVPANVIFINHAPILLNAPSAQVVAVDQKFDFSFIANQTFTDPDGDPLTYFAQLNDGSALPNSIYFNTSDPNQLRFTGIISNPSSQQLTIFAQDPLNATARAPLQIIAQSVGGSITNSNTNSISQIVAPISTTVGMAALAGGGFMFWRHFKNQKSRQGDRLANFLRDALHLKGVDNFYDSVNGRNYVSAVQNLSDALRNEGIDCDAMGDNELKELANDIASVARNTITTATDCSGHTVITVNDIKNKVQIIAKAVQQFRAIPIECNV